MTSLSLRDNTMHCAGIPSLSGRFVRAAKQRVTAWSQVGYACDYSDEHVIATEHADFGRSGLGMT